MGRVRDLSKGTELELPSRALVGRSENCWIQLDHRLSSKEHARLHWDGDQWMLRDLGSTNGTYAAGARLDPGVEVAVQVGAKIAFGDPEEQVYELISDDPPSAAARTLEGDALLFAEHGILVLPSDEAPEFTVFEAPDGSWCVEDESGEVKPVRSGVTLEAGGRSWRLDLPAPDDRTPIAERVLSLSTAALWLQISQDQERVDVGLATEAQVQSLGAKWYGYFLLVLARARQEDQDKPLAERGWRSMTDLSRMLKLDSNALNVATHRARREFAALGLRDAAVLIEIRRGYRRIGTDRVQIHQLGD